MKQGLYKAGSAHWIDILVIKLLIHVQLIEVQKWPRDLWLWWHILLLLAFMGASLCWVWHCGTVLRLRARWHKLETICIIYSSNKQVSLRKISVHHRVLFNTLYPGDATWRHIYGSTCIQVMACSLIAQSFAWTYVDWFCGIHFTGERFQSECQK